MSDGLPSFTLSLGFHNFQTFETLLFQAFFLTVESLGPA
ncbi:hypothetical protein STRDD12_00098 [Streptococcus sp. DD12]|nr:hypothetical protein STRDD12_00098 [Streptococcus sp. DD12]